MTDVVDEREPKADDVEGDGAQPELAETAPAPEGEARPRPKRRRSRRRRRGKAAASTSLPTAAVESASATTLDTQAPSASAEAELQPDRGEASQPAAQDSAAQPVAPAAEARRRKRRHGTAMPRPRRFPLARELREQLRRERQMALDTRDPLAIRLALDRYDVITAVLEGFSDDTEVDLDSITLGISQAAKALGYTPFQVREMIKLRKLAASKVNNQWRIPLRAVW